MFLISPERRTTHKPPHFRIIPSGAEVEKTGGGIKVFAGHEDVGGGGWTAAGVVVDRDIAVGVVVVGVSQDARGIHYSDDVATMVVEIAV